MAENIGNPSESSASKGRLTSASGVWTVIFLGVTAGVQMSDRGVQAILSPAIKSTFDVSDSVIGALHGIAGILVASALAVPLARLADRHSRKIILLALILLWTLLTALGALSPNFPLFFIGRAASGVTEFAMIPIVYSLIPDLVSERQRVSANLGFAALMAIGASAGFYFGGNLLEWVTANSAMGLEPWRITLLLLSLAGIPLLLVGLLVRDPPRHDAHADTANGDNGLPAFLKANSRQILLFLGAAGGLAVAVQATTPMAPMGLERRFNSDLGEIGHWLGIITLIASLSSLPVAGLVDRFLQRRLGQRIRPAIMAAGALLAIPCMIALGGATNEQFAIRAIAAFILLTCIANALIPTILQDILPPELRARGFAIYSFVIAAFCALGPFLSGFLSDHLVGNPLLLAIAIIAVPSLGVATICAALATRLGTPDASNMSGERS